MPTAKQLGIRKLGLMEYVRAGDLQWTKDAALPSTIDYMVITESGNFNIGQQICSEEQQNYGNAFYRKLNVKAST